MASDQSLIKPTVSLGSCNQQDDFKACSAKRLKMSSRTLPVTPSLYDAPFPFYRQPEEKGHFSIDAKRCFHGDARQLRYYAPPLFKGPYPGFDLRDGYHDRYVQRDESVREGLEHLLRWISHNQKQLQTEDQGRPLNADFVTWRGHLTKVLTTPYETQEGWLLAVSLFRGTLYIKEIETEAARKQREQRSELLKEFMYMGYKFEQYMCAATPGGTPDPTGVVNTNEGFCTVIRTRLGAHSLLFSGEVDCTDPRSPWPDPPSCYVELKTHKVMHSFGQRRSFYRYKMIKWWAQSFLPGVSRIVAGYRGPDGLVMGLETFETMKIFQLIQPRFYGRLTLDTSTRVQYFFEVLNRTEEDPGCWKPAVCMNFCAAFLAFLKEVVTEDNPKLVHLFAWNPWHPVSFTVHRDSQYTFLPNWYIETFSPEKPTVP